MVDLEIAVFKSQAMLCYCNKICQPADDEERKTDYISDSSMLAYICIVSPHDSPALRGRITPLY